MSCLGTCLIFIIISFHTYNTSAIMNNRVIMGYHGDYTISNVNDLDGPDPEDEHLVIQMLLRYKPRTRLQPPSDTPPLQPGAQGSEPPKKTKVSCVDCGYRVTLLICLLIVSDTRVRILHCNNTCLRTLTYQFLTACPRSSLFPLRPPRMVP
jgi:hypothetical protein